MQLNEETQMTNDVDEREYTLLESVAESKYAVIDNFLLEEEFEDYAHLLGSEIPMFYNDAVVSNKLRTTEDYYYHVHLLYVLDQPMSEYYQRFCYPLMSKVDMGLVTRAKVNWFPRTDTLYEHGVHIDLNYKHRNLLFYINDNDGYTRISKTQVVESKANRALILDGDVPHNSTTSTNTNLRCNMNINYIPLTPIFE